MRTILVPPGIGDFLWLAQKLQNANEKFHIVMSDGLPQRAHQLQELLPNIIESHEYRPKLNYRTINENSIHQTKHRWSHIAQPEFFLSANRHLEEGNRIETFLPDLETSFKINYTTSDDDKIEAEILLPEGKSYIGIYTSAYSNARNWNSWGVNEWYKLIKKLRHKNVVFVIVGASYDVGVVEDLTELMTESKTEFINTTGTQLSVVVEILKRLSYFLGFPSGLSILNETLEKDGVMFYSGPGYNKDGKVTPDHRKLMNSWPNPERIKNHNYKGCLFCPPEDLYEWLKNVYCLFDKVKGYGVGNVKKKIA